MRNRLLRRQTFIITVMAFVVFIVFAICIKDAMLGTAHGADSDECDQTVQIDDTVYACLYASGFDMEEEYYISEQFPVQNSIANAEKIYFVFCKDKCIGELLVSGSCEENIAFFQERCNEITDAYLHDVGLVIVRLDQDHIYIVRDDCQEVIYLYGVFDERMEFVRTTFDSLRIETRPIVENIRSVIDESSYINVPIRANATAPDTGFGLCWAASVLSMVDYKYGPTGYNALGLFYYLSAAYDHLIYGLPEGTSDWILRAYNLFNYSATYETGGYTFNQVKSKINSNKPIYAGIEYIDAEEHIHAHAIVINGYSRFSNNGLVIYY